MPGSGKSKRGFASMDAARQREIASKGGRAAHAKGTAHEWSSDEARVAGRKGGEVVSRDRAHMAAIGREGGESRGSRGKGGAAKGRREGARNENEQYTDRESRVELSREGMTGRATTGREMGGNDNRSARGDLMDEADADELANPNPS
jgi:general stress protein YciG